jgi:hypothetical protein
MDGYSRGMDGQVRGMGVAIPERKKESLFIFFTPYIAL